MCKQNRYQNLHCHSEYSMLDGYATIDKMVKRAKDLGQISLALTDHGNMFGIPYFIDVCKKEGIKPIIGVESYLTYDYQQKDKESATYHILLLAQNKTGYDNLLKLVSISQLDGFYKKPRIDFSLLEQYNEGLITTSGCMASQTSTYLLENRLDDAKITMSKYIDLFGKDRYYIELQEHSIPELTQINHQLIDLSKYFGIKPILTNDSHYVNKGDSDIHQIMLCVQTGSYLDAPVFTFSDDSYWLKSEDEMKETFKDYDQEVIELALETTLEIANSIDVYPISPNGYQIPKFLEHKNEEDELLKAKCFQELKNKKLIGNTTYLERLEYELKIVSQMNFSGYFLIIDDICAFARKNGIFYNTRGSAAGSIISWLLGISYPNPIEYNLQFERFLNPERVNMPDIDIDLGERDAVCEYIVSKYGENKVAQIINFNTSGISQALKDVSRVLRGDYGLAQQFSDHLKNEKPAEDFLKLHPEMKPIYEKAREIEGTVRQSGIHAAGVIITPEDTINYFHSVRTSKKLGTIKHLSSIAMDIVDKWGLLKVDLLLVDSLNILNEVSQLVNQRHGTKYNFDNIPIEDDCIFKLLAEGKDYGLHGVFQLEGDGITSATAELKPKSIHDIIAMVALYRPGPMAYLHQYGRRLHGEEELIYDHPLLEKALSVTQGIMVYQEQITQVLSDLAGFTVGEADIVRKGIGKKQLELITKNKPKFIDGCHKKGIAFQTAEKVWNDILYFSGYGFNRAHATSYGILAAKTAYMRAKYPLETYTILLTRRPDKKDIYIPMLKKLGINVLPPSIIKSKREFAISGDEIVFGLNAIKNIGERNIKRILGKSYKNLRDYLMGKTDKRELEALLYSGALDNGDLQTRWKLHKNVHLLLDYHKFKMLQLINVDDLLDDEIQSHDDLNFLLEQEKLYVGNYISNSPHALLEDVAKKLYPDLNRGVVQSIKRHIDKKGNEMAFLMIDNKKIVVFASLWDKYCLIQEGDYVVYDAKEDGILLSMKRLPNLRIPLPYNKEKAKLFLL